jgi:hypothetical protein
MKQTVNKIHIEVEEIPAVGFLMKGSQATSGKSEKTARPRILLPTTLQDRTQFIETS